MTELVRLDDRNSPGFLADKPGRKRIPSTDTTLSPETLALLRELDRAAATAMVRIRGREKLLLLD